MLLESLLEARASQAPERVALVAGGRRVTWGELEAQSNRLGRALVRLGVRRGDRVAIWLDNSVEAVSAIFAALKAGACFMMINSGTRPQKLGYLLDDARARALVLPARKLGPLVGAVADRPHLGTLLTVGGAAIPVAGKQVIALEEAAQGEPDTPPEKRCIDLDLAALLYTSGSTGDPKGVMLSHRNVLSATRSIVEYLHLGPGDVLFDVLPLSFGYGLTQLFSASAVGARLVVENGMVFPHLALTRLCEERATGFAIVPTTAAILLGLDLGRYDLSSLRYLTNAGAGLPPDQARRLRAALPHVKLYCMYGQTECLRTLYLEPDQVDLRPGSVGRGMPNQELFLVDEQGREVGPAEPGELVVRGAHVMRGYWGQPAETAKKLRPLDGAIRERENIPEDEKALYTGDLFRRDGEGYFYFVGRTDEVFKSRGEKVSPYEVESALYGLDGVAEAAVVGVPDPMLGHSVKAVVVRKPGCVLGAQDIRRYCAGRLDGHMVPDVIEFRDELPKNERGKITRRALLGG